VAQVEAIHLLLSTVTHFALVILPCFAACAFVVRKGVHDVVLAGLVALVALGISGYAGFWIWFVSPQLGRVFSLSLPVGAALFLIWTFPRLDAAGRSVVKALLCPMCLVGAAALLVLSTGFMFGGIDAPSRTAQIRFSHVLPDDNDMPFLFAEGLRNGKVPKPLLIDWRTSDRPPLQTGIVLIEGVYMQHPRRLQYTITSVILQSLWIFGLWLFLAASDLDPRPIALALMVGLFSGFVFLNSFFVWPKLLAGAYMLGFSAILLANRFAAALRDTTFVPALAGALAALGLLAHGGSVFAIFGLVLTILVIRKRIELKILAIVALACICLYLPWIAYQRFYDPPGDRLLKYHLAGAQKLDDRSFVRALLDSYESLSFRQFLHNKASNATAVVDHQAEYWHGVVQLLRQSAKSDPNSTALVFQTSRALRGLCFFFFVPSLGFLVLGPASLILGIHNRYRSREWKTAAMMWLYVAFTAGIWCLIMFTPGMTVLHTSTYAIVLLSVAGSVVALWAVSPWLAVIVGSLQIEINFLLYISFMPSPFLIGSPDQGSLRLANVGLALLSLTCTFFILRNIARRAVRFAE
jgi:hypothetical protein